MNAERTPIPWNVWEVRVRPTGAHLAVLVFLYETKRGEYWARYRGRIEAGAMGLTGPLVVEVVRVGGLGVRR